MLSKKTLNRYFDIVNSADKMSITGEEPLLHFNFCEVLQEVIKYADRINNGIIIITNGTKLITEQLINVFKISDKNKVIVNDYEKHSKDAKVNYQFLTKNNFYCILYTEKINVGGLIAGITA